MVTALLGVNVKTLRRALNGVDDLADKKGLAGVRSNDAFPLFAWVSFGKAFSHALKFFPCCGIVLLIFLN
jgi:hypothetical protein